MSPRPPQPSLTIDKPSANILGIRVDALGKPEALRRACELMQGPSPALLVTANALLAIEAQSNSAFRESCLAAELVTADGVGLVWAANRLRQPTLERLPGIDLAWDLCSEARQMGVSVFLLGAAPGVAERAAEFLKRSIQGLQVTGIKDGFFSSDADAEIIDAIVSSGARLILVAFGSPRQELWVHQNRSKLPAGLYVGVGGSFDVWAGLLRRAPVLARKMGLEWLFRLLQEPTRIGRMLQLPKFAWRVEKARQQGK